MGKCTYIITGASSDVALHYLSRLGSRLGEGDTVKVYAQYRTSDASLREMEQRYKTLDMDIRRCDLASGTDTLGWIASIRDSCMAEGTVPTHILHLAAPRFSYMRLKELDWGRFVSGMDVSVRSLALLLKEFLPAMARAKFGRIAVMLTAYTIGVPPKFMADYITVKYALLGLLRAAAAEYPGKGVAINGLSPNMMETKFLNGIDERTIEMNAQSAAMRRNVTLDETCAAIEYLMSVEAGYMQGMNMNLSGGDRM